MSVLPVQRELFTQLSDQINQQPSFEPIEHDDVFVEKEESQEVKVTYIGSDIDHLQMSSLSKNEIPNISITEEVAPQSAQKNEQSNTQPTDPSFVDIMQLNALSQNGTMKVQLSQAQEDDILAQIKEPFLENEAPKVLEEKKPKFSLSRVCQKMTARLSKFLSFFSFKKTPKQESKEETREVNEVQIVKVEQRKVEQSSENLAKILEKLPKSLLDKLNQLQEEKKIKGAFLNATRRYEAVINSSARKYSKLTLEQKTDLALQEGARVISNALNILK
jgi:hypothetical protein